MTTYTEISSNKKKSVFLIIIFIVVLIALGWIIEQIEGNGSYGIIIVAFLFSLVSALVGYYGGARIALSSNGAFEITKEQNPYLFRMVENLCLTIGMPTPKIYVIPDAAINAFATGRDPQHAHIAVTQGALEKLENEELEGVLAHELSHIQNYDIRFLTLVVVLVGTIIMVSDLFLRSRFLFGGRRGGSDKNPLGGVLMLVGIILLILSPLIAQLIKFAISRKREYLADASGVLMTRYPQGLANALRKIAGEDLKMQRVNNASAHLFLANPFGAYTVRGGMSKLFATHPPIEDRIKELEKMAGGPQPS